MMRKLAVALAFAGALGNNFANAVGLGELKLNSALNQKFDAEIKLLNIGDLSKNEILPNLASHEDFARAGVERVFFLTGVKFDVRFADDGSAFIKLTSDKIVREPFLNFLVELHWPSGRILREYTVLLDPPAFSEAPAAKVTEASSGGSSVQLKKKVSQPQATRPYTSSGPVSTSSRTSGASEGSVRVKKHDTLWGIAKANRPSDEVSIRQTMLAIQRHNPQAFINNNINLLKAGQVLRIPNVDQIRSLSAYEVNEEISRQNQAWQQNRTIDASQDDNFADDQTAAADDDYAASGQLKLLSDDSNSPENLADNASGASLENEDGGDYAGGSGVSGLAGDKAGDHGASESTVSGDQVEALRDQVDSLQRLLTLKDEQLAMLQTGQSNDESSAEAASGSLAGDYQMEDATGVGQSDETMADNGATLSPEGEEASEEEAAASTVAAVEEAAPAEEKPAPVKEVSKPEQGLVATLMDNPIYIGLMLLGILIALLVMGAISRRKNAERDYPEDLREALNAAQTGVDLPAELDEEEEVTESAVQDEPEMDPEMQQQEAAIRKLVEEADIYIAYGRYERALEMLRPAVNENPRAVSLRLKLVEVFLATGDAAGLSQQEADLAAIGDQGALQKLAALKEEAGHESAEGDGVVDVAENNEIQEEEDEISFEQYDDEESDMPFEELGAEPEDELNDGVEFTLDDADAENTEATDELTEGLGDNELEEMELEEATDDMDFLADTDEVATKLELGRAYIDMADKDAAVDILNEVVEDGNEEQKEEAKRLLQSIAS